MNTKNVSARWVCALLLSFGLAGVVGCTDKIAECKATTDKTYAADIAKCGADAECKKKADENKKTWYATCDELK